MKKYLFLFLIFVLLTVLVTCNQQAINGISFLLDISITGSGSVVKNPDQEQYSNGDNVLLTANGSSGYRFDHWVGDITGSVNPVSVVMDSNKSLTAVFVEIPRYTIQLSVFDQTGDSVDNAVVQILETGLNQTLATNIENIEMEEGDYTLYISKNGYRSRGYTLKLDSNKNITVVLKDIQTQIYDYEDLSGTFQIDSVDVTTDFYISSGIKNYSDVTKVTANPNGIFSSVTSRCGNNTISAYLKDLNKKITSITYLKDQILDKGIPLNSLLLNYQDVTTSFYGGKPLTGDLKVKLNNKYYIARQDTDSNTNDYDFNIELQTNDTVTLESVNYENSFDTYFTRMYAGDSTSDITLDYITDLPDFTVSEMPDYYLVTFNSVAGVSYYSVYAFEVDNLIVSVPFVTDCLTGNSIKIPKGVINGSADEVRIFVSAVLVESYNQSQLLDNTLSLQQYRYSETGIDLLNVLNGSSRSVSFENMRMLYNMNSLAIEL